ncbi:MAG: tRNA uridine-5-carboxymethylaminomethyl(34) synthesis GTPase MnmE [Chlamydiae bacterium]|nr:tRNA uridine-5-carboxymethylaminomethyl(34) synthesis GTPase MnmE [Chlamydiota bacterium]
MEYVHRSYEKGRTVAAVATPPGEGGIAVIRLSGDDAFSIAQKIFSKDISLFASHTAHYGKIVDSHGRVIDEVLLLILRGKRSFTGEDTVEIHCHGGTLITRRVLQRVLEAGAYPALPGEFSFKAFINGKIDLTQAEAIQELISSKNQKALTCAQETLQGHLKTKIASLQQTLTHITAIFEAWVDYPEEGLEFASYEEILALLEETHKNLQTLCHSYEEGKIVKEGLHLCLLGLPNAGKSSLMNALSGQERAIVTNIAGTTRDTLDEEVRLGDLHFTLTDTAGIRETHELIEQEGIKRSFHAAAHADILLFVADIHLGWGQEEKDLLTKLPPHKTLLIWNKIDTFIGTTPSCSHPHQIFLSAKTGDGLNLLKEAIHRLMEKKHFLSNDQLMITSQRHYHALTKACQAIERALQGLQTNLSPELLSIEMKEALHELGIILGRNISEDILNAIFSKFCVGK